MANSTKVRKESKKNKASEHKKALELLQEVKKHTVEGSSSREIIEKLMGDEYSNKLRLVDDITHVNNYINATKLSDKIWNIGVIVDTERYKKAPTDQVKRIDWIYKNMEHINVYIEL